MPRALHRETENVSTGEDVRATNGQAPPVPRRPANRSELGTLKAIAREISDATDRGRKPAWRQRAVSEPKQPNAAKAKALAKPKAAANEPAVGVLRA